MNLTLELIDLIGSGNAKPNDYARFARCFAEDFRDYWQAVKRREASAPAVDKEWATLIYLHTATEQVFNISPTEDDPDALTYIVSTEIKGKPFDFTLTVCDTLADEIDGFLYDGILPKLED